METRHKVEQVKAYLNAIQNPKNPLHDAVKEEKEVDWQKASHGWVKQNNQSSMCAASQTSSKQGIGKYVQLSSSPTTRLLSENLCTPAWPAGKTNAEVQMLVEANSKPLDIVIYTDDLVTRDRSGWGFTVKQGGRTVHKDNGAHRVTTSGLTMEVEAVTHAIQWLASQRDAKISHAIIYHRLNEPPAKGGVSNGLPRLAHSHAQSLATKISVDLLSWAHRSQWE